MAEVPFNLDFEYPLTHFPLPAPERAGVRLELELLATEYGLFQQARTWSQILEVFIANCSPRGVNSQMLQLLSHFLYMTLYLNEERSRGLQAELVQAYWGVLRGGAVSSALDAPNQPPHPLLRCAARFRPRLNQYLASSIVQHSIVGQSIVQQSPIQHAASEHGIYDLSGFYHYVGLNLSAFLHDSKAGGLSAEQESSASPERGGTASGRRGASSAAYAAVRLHTISALGYFRLWKLLLGLDAEAELSAAAQLFRCELLSAELQGMANDLASLARDRADASANWVQVVAQQHGLSRDAAFARVSEQHAHGVREYLSAERDAREASNDPRVWRYLEFIGSCTAGNLKSMQELRARYT